MEEIKIGDRVRMRGTQIGGVVTEIKEDGQVSVRLDNDGGLLTTMPSALELANVNGERGPGGQFLPGHARLPPNPQKAAAKASARAIRQTMLTELEPFFSKIGTYVGQCPTAVQKINALSKLAPYVLPALSRVEFTDQTPRNLSIEEQLMEFALSQAKKKKP